MKSDIKKFDGKDFGLWKSKVTNALMYLNLDSHLSVKMEFESTGAHTGKVDPNKERDNKKTLAFVKGTLTDKLFNRYDDKKEAKDLWDAILKDYEQLDAQQLFLLRNKYIYSVKNKNQSVSDYISYLAGINAQIKSSGYEMSEIDCILTLLNGTNDEFSEFMSSVTAKAKVSELKLKDLEDKLIAEDNFRRSFKRNRDQSEGERHVLVTKNNVQVSNVFQER